MMNKENIKVAIDEIKDGAVQCFNYAEDSVGKLAELYDDLSELEHYYSEKAKHLKSLIVD